MSNRLIVVKAVRDAEAGVWFVESSDIPGLNAEAETLEELLDKLPAAIGDLVQERGESETGDVPIELIAHASLRLLPAA